MKLATLLNEPWAIAKSDYELISQMALKGADIEAMKRRRPTPSGDAEQEAFFFYGDNSGSRDELQIRADGTALIPVQGYLTRRSYWRGDRASYEWIGSQLDQALASSAARSIQFLVDSPGGQLQGIEELASKIYSARDSKPTTSIVIGEANSAAYWIATSASRVIAGRASVVGSIGVLYTTYDWSKFEANEGIERISIVSSNSPDKDIDPKSEHGQALIRAMLDDLSAVFVADVARNRGVSAEKVVSDFGRGFVLVGQQALEAGMVDEIRTGPVDVSSGSGYRGVGLRATGPASGGQEGSMETVNVNEITAAWLEKHRPEIAAELRNAGVEAGRKEAELAAESKVDEAVKAEAQRVQGILEAVKGTAHGELAAKFIADPKVSVEAAKAAFFEAEKSKLDAKNRALAGDEAGITPPTPSNGDETDAKGKHAERITATAQKAGLPIRGDKE